MGGVGLEGIPAALPKLFRQFLSRPKEPGFHGPFRASQNLTNFRQSQFTLMMQDKTGSVLFAERAEQLFHNVRQPLNLGNRRGLDVERLFRGTGKSPLPFQMSSAAIRGNREYPRLQRTASIPSPQMPYRPEERDLRHIFRVVTMPQHPETEPKHTVFKPFNQFPNSLGISRETAANEFAFVVHLALLSRHNELPRRLAKGFVGCNI
jgi:hypothetical protein